MSKNFFFVGLILAASGLIFLLLLN